MKIYNSIGVVWTPIPTAMPTDIEMANPKLYKYFNTLGDFPSESSTPSRNDIMQWCMTSAESIINYWLIYYVLINLYIRFQNQKIN